MRATIGVLAVVAACRTADPAPPPEPAPEVPDTATQARKPGSACTIAPGERTETIAVAGTERVVERWVGPDATADAPVVLAWHGFGSDPSIMMSRLDLDVHWRDAIVLAPHGLPRTFDQFGETARPGWQVHLGELEDRDLALFDALIERLRDEGCGDLSRVYTTGFSNGGFFSNVLACHRAEAIAAAAPVGGGGPFVTGCGPAPAVLLMHGRHDRVVAFAQATESFSTWTAHARCGPAQPPPDGACTRAPDCRDDAEITLCAFAGDHVWPPDHAARVAEFLRRHARAPKSGMRAP
jgi:polyhydroxybutyrate depolymerase